MTTTPADVRVYLDNLSDDRVKDPVIQKQLELTTRRVNAEKSEIATAESIADAILTNTGYAVYLAYTSQYERTAGQLPAQMLANLGLYAEAANYFMGLAMRGTVVTKTITSPIASLITEVRNGNYES